MNSYLYRFRLTIAVVWLIVGSCILATDIHGLKIAEFFVGIIATSGITIWAFIDRPE